MSLQAPQHAPLLTFATSLTSAHSLLGSRQDPRGVDDADTLQDLIGQLGTLEPGIYVSTERGRVTLTKIGVNVYSRSSEVRFG